VLAFQSYHCDQYKPSRDSILLQSWASPKIVYVRVLEKTFVLIGESTLPTFHSQMLLTFS
jgi:hypothetical protein